VQLAAERAELQHKANKLRAMTEALRNPATRDNRPAATMDTVSASKAVQEPITGQGRDPVDLPGTTSAGGNEAAALRERLAAAEQQMDKVRWCSNFLALANSCRLPSPQHAHSTQFGVVHVAVSSR